MGHCCAPLPAGCRCCRSRPAPCPSWPAPAGSQAAKAQGLTKQQRQQHQQQQAGQSASQRKRPVQAARARDWPASLQYTASESTLRSTASTGWVSRLTSSRPAITPDTGWMHWMCSPSPHTAAIAWGVLKTHLKPDLTSGHLSASEHWRQACMDEREARSLTPRCVAAVRMHS